MALQTISNKGRAHRCSPERHGQSRHGSSAPLPHAVGYVGTAACACKWLYAWHPWQGQLSTPFLHPSSALHKAAQEWLVCSQTVQRDKRIYMSGEQAP